MCHSSHLLQIAGGTSGDLGAAEDDLLSSAAAQRGHDARKDLALRDEAGVLAGREPCQATCLTTRDERDLQRKGESMWILA